MHVAEMGAQFVEALESCLEDPLGTGCDPHKQFDIPTGWHVSHTQRNALAQSALEAQSADCTMSHILHTI